MISYHERYRFDMNIIKRFIDCKIPLQTCTLRCHYCYVTHNKLFENKIPVFKYDANFIGNALTQKKIRWYLYV